MTKTRNKLKIMGLVLALVMMVSLLGLFSLTASAAANSVSYGALTDHSLVDGTCTECGEVGYTYDEATNTYTACTGTDTAALYEDTTYPYAVVDTEAGTLTIDGTLGGKTTATEEDITALVEQLKAYVDSGNTTIIVTGSKPAMIEVSGLTITAIGEAIYRLSLDDSYNGKIDLILPDVTEIIDKEFYSAQALNSITLPKVTKLGSLAFYGTQYLRIITFGSVLTEVNETGGVMFAYVGNKVGGCDLILNCGQMNESSVPVPDLTINTWGYENEFKSITLTHTGGTATCSELAKCEVCGTEYGEVGAHTAEPTYVPNAGDSTQHDATYSCCGATVTEAHTMNVTTGKCDECGADMTVVATVTDGTNTYYAADAATLNQAVTAILETGSRTFTVELPADASAGMITAIRRAICDTEGVADGSINLTLKGVTTIPGTTNWDGVAFGPGDIYDEAGKIVDQELVTQLASINLPDVTEIGAQAFYFCENLVSVSAPKAQTIGAQAFGYTALTSVEFPELTTIPTDMFSGTWTLSSAKFPKVTTIEQGGLLVGAKFTPENNPTPFPLELTAEGNITFNGSNHFNIASQNYSGKVDLVLCCDKKDAVTFNEDGTATWQVREDLSYTFKSITFKHSYVDGKCTACGEDCTHTGGEATCTEKAICDLCGTSYGEVDTTNHDSSVECVNGFCPNGCYEPAILNAEGYYEIDNAGKLFWFAQQVNVKGNREIKGVLTAHIDLENRPWTPIGSTGEENNNFRGVFDGQNYTIRGLYVEGSENGVGFFGEVRTGTVKNFTIYGNVVVNTEVDYVGGVIGSICGVNGETDLERNGAIIQNITSFVNVTAKAHGIGMIGGFVGYANHQSLIEQCAWYGTFDAGEYRVDSGAGGFIGKIQENTSEVTIRNCGAYGTIKTNYAKNSYNNTPTIYMGGFLSFSNTGAGTVLENCLFAGKFERGENLTDEAFLGAFGTLRSVNAIKNCYYLGDDGLEAVHSDSNLKPGSDNVEITSVTGEELRNNTIATQLGDHWMQDVHYPIPKDTKAHSDSATYTYTDNGDGTHKATCTECGYEETSRPHTIENHACTDCGAMEIVVSFDAGDYEWKTGDTLYFCRVSGDNEWEEYAFTATVAGDGTVTWTPDRTLYWDGTGEHKLVVIYPDTGYVWDTWYVDEDQATPETLRKNDRLDAIWSGNPTTDTITFNLKHRMAKVTVNYEAAEGVTISKAEVYTLTQYVFFDVDTLERRNIAWEEGDDLWIHSYLNDGQFTAFVSPDAYAAGGNFIKITLSDGSVREVKMNKAVTFAEGAEYTYKVVITADGAYLTCADECTFEYTDNEDGLTHSKTCSKCGYVAASEAHSGGEATCTTKAVCDLCGTEYGEPAPNAHSFVDGKCACGMKQFDIYGQQLNIGGDLSMKYYVTALGDGVSTETLKMKFNFLGKETEVSGVYDSETRMYVFTLEGINPQCMGDKIDAYLILDGEEKASKLSYTVEENLLALREEYKDDEALVTLVNDILAYGTAASEYKNHNSMTDVYVGSDREIPDASVTPSGAFTGYTVVFGQVNFIKVGVTLTEGQTLYLDGTDITVQVKNGIFKTDGIAPTNFDKNFTFEIKNGDTVVQTFSVSVNDYISAKKDSATMGSLVKALYNYGVSAEIYNHIKAGNGEHIYAYTDNGDGTHSKMGACGNNISSEAHTAVNHICTDCGAMEIVVSFDAGDYEWKTGDTLYFCRVSRDNEWEEYCFTATVAEDGTVTWTPDKPL